MKLSDLLEQLRLYEKSSPDAEVKILFPFKRPVKAGDFPIVTGIAAIMDGEGTDSPARAIFILDAPLSEKPSNG